MEMHQIRYFLAVARTLNFTRAAEECNVAQPSLTRAIKNLEAELGGDLFRRERASSHLTDLGRAMLPFLTNSLESALAAKSQAVSIKDGKTGSLRIALTWSVDFDVVAGALKEVSRAYQNVSLTCQRASQDEVLESLRSGETDLAISGPINESWERLNSRPLFDEPHCVTVSKNHPIAEMPSVHPKRLAEENIIIRPYCEQWSAGASLLKANNVDTSQGHEVVTDQDAIRLLEAELGVGLLPASVRVGGALSKIPLVPTIERTVSIHYVVGRERSKVMSGLINLLCSADWTRYQSMTQAG